MIAHILERSLDHRRLRDVVSPESRSWSRGAEGEKKQGAWSGLRSGAEAFPLLVLAALWRACRAGQSSESLSKELLKGGLPPPSGHLGDKADLTPSP